MIEVTRMDGKKILLNPNLMETVEETPDTVITLTTGRKLIVKESRQDIQNLVKSFLRDWKSSEFLYDILSVKERILWI